MKTIAFIGCLCNRYSIVFFGISIFLHFSGFSKKLILISAGVGVFVALICFMYYLHHLSVFKQERFELSTNYFSKFGFGVATLHISIQYPQVAKKVKKLLETELKKIIKKDINEMAKNTIDRNQSN